MKTRTKIWLGILLGLAIVAVAGWYLGRHPVDVLQPAGQIGTKERNLIIFTAAASSLVVAPVFILLGVFAWKYRESAAKAAGGKPAPKYHPDEEGNWKIETIWWLIPTLLMVVISIITWRSSYALDPFKPLASSQKPLHIQVVSLDWKWLFIYPDQHVASVNYAPIPAGRPVVFDITSDTVMTSFWVPQLGGQMYAMPGMVTQLNLEAAKTGTYNGSTANIAGKGFADMTFTVRAMPPADFTAWAQNAHATAPATLTSYTYAQLAEPSKDNPPQQYNSVESGLYDTIVMKYMMPMGDNTNTLDATPVTGVTY